MGLFPGRCEVDAAVAGLSVTAADATRSKPNNSTPRFWSTAGINRHIPSAKESYRLMLTTFGFQLLKTG
jgi:hypothetical protein